MNVPRLSSLKLFAPAFSRPALAPAGQAGMGGTMMFARGRDDYDYDDDDPEFENDAPPPPRSSRRVSGGGGSGGGNGGRPRTIQFQPEERYWTDYLRIALPIIGLLLMVGLFWYWATQLIDDEPNTDDPVATATVGAPELAGNASTPAPTAPPAVQGQAPADDPTLAPEEETPANEENEPEETPLPDDEQQDVAFEIDDAATIISDSADGINMRSDPVIPDTEAGEEENVVAELVADTPVTIVGGPEEANGFTWWEVTVEENGETGWVAEDFLQLAE